MRVLHVVLVVSYSGLHPKMTVQGIFAMFYGTIHCKYLCK